jgi:hypothetical protein
MGLIVSAHFITQYKMSQGTSLYNMFYRHMPTDTVSRYKITDDLKKTFVACAIFFQPGKQTQFFGRDRGRQAPLVSCKP